MEGYLNGEMMNAYKEMEVKIDASSLQVPGNLSVGQELDDGSITVEIYTGGMKVMTMVTTIKDRKVEAKEDVTTPAGTFSCFKISETVESKSMISVVVKSIEWLCPGTGMVKNESYTSDDKIMSSSELIKIN